jgi:hypothetical protein
MRVFISYGGPADQVTALRLQALANVHGLTVYVPPASTRYQSPALLDAKIQQELLLADIVLGVIGTGWSDACSQELNTGISLGKRIIPITTPLFVAELQRYFRSNVIVIDPANPDQAEKAIVQYLKSVDAEQSVKSALLALGTLALGLLIFEPAASD